nr:copia protein [Tanacetum cinerariifolium]
MSRDVLTVGSTMRIPLLYRGEYSQWVERFMNYLEEQTDGEAMINLIKDGDQPLPRVTQVSIARTSSTEQPPLKDKSMCNKTAKDLWDALARHMFVSQYGEQDRKATVLYEYETFKDNEGELLLDTYIRYLQVINDLKKCGYSEDNCELNFKFLNNLQPEWKQYATMMRQNKNLIDVNIDALYNILKHNQGDINDAMGLKNQTVVVTYDPLDLIAKKTKVNKSKEKVVVFSDSKGSEADDFSELKKITALLAKDFNQRKFYSKTTNNNLRTSSTCQSANKKQEFVKTDNKKVEKKDDEKKRDISRVKCYNSKKEGHFAKDCKKVKVKDYEYYKTKIDSDQEINANMVFMVQIEKVILDSEASSLSVDDKIFEVSYYLFELESESDYETSEYYDNTTNYVARIKAIRLFLAYAPHKDLTVFQMDVKRTFLNGTLKEEVYVGQPPGFVSKQYPDHVYALNKALYGLKQAPRAWYDVLSRLLIESGFQKVPTPMVEQAKLKLDLVGKVVDHSNYRSIIGSL